MNNEEIVKLPNAQSYSWTRPKLSAVRPNKV